VYILEYFHVILNAEKSQTILRKIKLKNSKAKSKKCSICKEKRFDVFSLSSKIFNEHIGKSVCTDCRIELLLGKNNEKNSTI